MPSLPFDERIDRAGHLIGLSRRFFDIWWLYIGADTRPEIIHGMNRFPEFFRFDEHAHFVALVTHLASLFERRTDTVNFEALINEAAANALVPEDVIQSARDTLRAVEDLRPKVAILRSNAFSHRSASLSYKEAFNKAAFTPFQLRDLTDAGRKIANLLLEARGHPPVIFTMSTAEQTKGMLRLIDRGS